MYLVCICLVGEFYKPKSAMLLFYGQLEASSQGHTDQDSLIFGGVGREVTWNVGLTVG